VLTYRCQIDLFALFALRFEETGCYFFRLKTEVKSRITAVMRTIQYGEKTCGCSFAFFASTGRTATMFVAKTLNSLPDIFATHEGHVITENKSPALPLLNFHNRKAWYEPDYAARTAAKMRSKDILLKAAGDTSVFVDIAFNNAPFMDALATQHPSANFLAIFRRCEGFVRSATITAGEDTQPAGWPDRNKPLTDREKFVELGRLKPLRTGAFGDSWDGWSAIQRNIWLWTTVNSNLFDFIQKIDAARGLYFEDLVNEPMTFWGMCLGAIGQNSPTNLERCVALSARKTNQRATYQVGPVATWSEAEYALYEKLALPLEEKIYGR
jgi:hypothetical protein